MSLEDVYDLYERTRLVYNKCSSKKCTRFHNDTCWCSLNDSIQPLLIGQITTPCKFNRKFYIRPGNDDCSICLEKIMMKKNAFITGCGHAFHRNCLFKYFEIKQNQKPFSTLRCPLCRCSLGLPVFFERYNFIQGRNIHYLDLLENFWLTKDYQLPHFCSKKSHYLGMNKNCSECKKYVKNG